MDLNFLYSEHQISLIRASAAKTSELRVGHEADAYGLAQRIRTVQQGLGTPAALAWSLAL